jgi:hypothetical protein
MNDDAKRSHDAVTTPVGVTTICPQCGVVLDAITTTCGACGAVITDSGAGAERSERVRAKLQNGIGEAFLLGDMLGRGGMGIVFRARETALDRDVALKVLAFDPILNPDAYARFEREAKLAARLIPISCRFFRSVSATVSPSIRCGWCVAAASSR